MFMSLFFDYRVSADGIYLMLFHALPFLVCRMDRVIDVERIAVWRFWYSPFQTVSLINRARLHLVLIRRRGFIKFLLLTPEDPEAFIRDMERYRAAAPVLRRPAQDSGFTLLETLVALTIVALGFAYAFAAMPESLGAQDRARNLETATSLAQSLLAEAGPATEGTEGKFAWHIDAAPAATGRPQQPGDFGGQTERVTIRWAEDKQDRSIALQTVRLGLLPRGP